MKTNLPLVVTPLLQILIIDFIIVVKIVKYLHCPGVNIERIQRMQNIREAY